MAMQVVRSPYHIICRLVYAFIGYIYSTYKKNEMFNIILKCIVLLIIKFWEWNSECLVKFWGNLKLAVHIMSFSGSLYFQ